jgi:prepilin-type N-terminal cleavage/methylation domain-containing protein
MSLNRAAAQARARRGFSLVEMSVVVIIIGVLVAFGIPRMLKSVERSKAAAACEYLAAVRAAQEKYREVHGTYADNLANLSIDQPAPTYFTLGTIAAGDSGSLTDSWTLTVKRHAAATNFGSYTITFTNDGYHSLNSTIEGLPDINPMSR